jgi:PHD/YefM family antitoxin component YafN of YafNO toxin-antitoxin module
MISTKEQFLVDEQGNRTAVLIDVKRYDEFLEALEEIDSIRAFDQAKSANDETIPFSRAIEEIENSRK